DRFPRGGLGRLHRDPRFRRHSGSGAGLPLAIGRPRLGNHGPYGAPPLRREQTMKHSHTPPRSDAFVFFGATGDLAYKSIFPALQRLARRGELEMPVIGVARSGWNLDQLLARARDSLQQHGGVDEAAFAKLAGRLQYIDGDYSDPNTYERLCAALGGARHPLHYLAIPPDMFTTVADALA